MLYIGLVETRAQWRSTACTRDARLCSRSPDEANIMPVDAGYCCCATVQHATHKSCIWKSFGPACNLPASPLLGVDCFAMYLTAPAAGTRHHCTVAGCGTSSCAAAYQHHTACCSLGNHSLPIRYIGTSQCKYKQCVAAGVHLFTPCW